MSCEVVTVYRQPREVVVVAKATEVVTAVARGPQGPAGPVGPAGAVDDYTATFASASSTWTVNHNLGREPVIQVLTAGGVEMEAAIVHVSSNQAQVNFASPQTGRVRAI